MLASRNATVGEGRFPVRRLYLSGIGRQVDFEIWRDGETLHIPVTIEERPAEAVAR